MCQGNPEGSGITLARGKAKLNFSLFLERRALAAEVGAPGTRWLPRLPIRPRRSASLQAVGAVEVEAAVVEVAAQLRDRSSGGGQ